MTNDEGNGKESKSQAINLERSDLIRSCFKTCFSGEYLSRGRLSHMVVLFEYGGRCGTGALACGL